MKNRISKIKIGDEFGRLKVIDFYERKEYKSYWLCLCKCYGPNFIRIVREDRLLSGNTKSCGCIRKEMYNSMKK